MSSDALVFNRERFTDTQRRRAEALILVRVLFPSPVPVDVTTQFLLARWVATGRSELSEGWRS